jgi:hypothetical protein
MKSAIPPFEEMFSLPALFAAWKSFERGKRKRVDVCDYRVRLIERLSVLHRDLSAGTYRHGGYSAFTVSDPKPRMIHKAHVRDRIVHHAIHRALVPFFEARFIYDSYSCRANKGTHRSVKRLAACARRESANHTKTVWVLQCDIAKCFASIGHERLLSIIRQHIVCNRTMAVIEEVVRSFSITPHKGIPLGNLTSQLFVNVYLNLLDQFIKRMLGARIYLRYTDDFVIVSRDRKFLETSLEHIHMFVRGTLGMELHPHKVRLKTLSSGVDFLGWINFPDHRVLRPSTRHRMERALAQDPSPQTRSSYRGLCVHGDTHGLVQRLFDGYSGDAQNATLSL